MSRSTSSGYGTPAAAHIRGYIDDGVKPGIVLISLMTSRPSVQHEEVDPGKSLAADRVERRDRESLDRALSARAGSSAGHAVGRRRPRRRYFASKS